MIGFGLAIASLAVLAVWAAWSVAVRASAAPNRRVVYIAAPFAPCLGLDATENTRRAVVLAALYRRRGFDVVCVHPDILAGRYGDDADPVQRAEGAARTLALCGDVATRGGRLVALLMPDGRLSPGSAGEVAAFAALGGRDRIDWWMWPPGRSGPTRVDPPSPSDYC